MRQHNTQQQGFQWGLSKWLLFLIQTQSTGESACPFHPHLPQRDGGKYCNRGRVSHSSYVRAKKWIITFQLNRHIFMTYWSFVGNTMWYYSKDYDAFKAHSIILSFYSFDSNSMAVFQQNTNTSPWLIDAYKSLENIQVMHINPCAK